MIKRTTVLRTLGVLAGAMILSGAGAAFARADLNADSTSVGSGTALPPAVTVVAVSTTATPVVTILVPDRDAFLRTADYVSPDGRQVRSGDVAISTTGTVSRAGR